MTDETNNILLEVKDLQTSFFMEEGEVRAVDGASFSLRRGQILAIVGESGCGKSVTAYSILRLIRPPGRIVAGEILLHAEPGQNGPPVDIVKLSEKDERLFDIRGGRISMIFQEPMTALSPVHTIGNQMCEAVLLHQDVTAKQARAKAVQMLSSVGIPNAQKRLDQYPHEMSGGMRQRVVIAMALSCNPDLLIADEPTTALDVTIQAQILHLILRLREDIGMGVLLITHDLGVVAQTAEEVAVMYLGRIVERAAVRPLLKSPIHPYTRGLLASLPSRHVAGKRLPSIAGSVPSPSRRPPGCPFHPRCKYAQPGRCDQGEPPELRLIDADRSVACVRAEEI